QFRFGARTGLAPIIFGAVLLVLAIALADHAAALFALIPMGAVGSLLIFAGTDLAISRRYYYRKYSRLRDKPRTRLVNYRLRWSRMKSSRSAGATRTDPRRPSPRQKLIALGSPSSISRRTVFSETFKIFAVSATV